MFSPPDESLLGPSFQKLRNYSGVRFSCCRVHGLSFCVVGCLNVYEFFLQGVTLHFNSHHHFLFRPFFLFIFLVLPSQKVGAHVRFVMGQDAIIEFCVKMDLILFCIILPVSEVPKESFCQHISNYIRSLFFAGCLEYF